MKQFAVSVEFNLFDDEGHRLRDGIRSGARSEIHAEKLLAPFQLDPDTYFELWGLERTGAVGTPTQVLRVMSYLLPRYFAISGGRPLLWTCGLRDAAIYLRMAARRGSRYTCTILRGSLRPNNPYPPLVMHHDTGGSDDEHIVRLAERTT